MITANRQANAGPCVNGGRHKLGPETNRRDGGVNVWYDEPCLKCARVRVRIYTRRGNRIDGYETRGRR
jgi:hypothetical protein